MLDRTINLAAGKSHRFKMEELKLKRPLGIELDGCVYAVNGEDLLEEDFSDAFIEFIEAKGWYFGGGLTQVDEEGNDVLDIE